MPNNPVYTIETSDLEIGQILPFDLRGPDGAVVHKAGLPITQRLLDRLATLGVTKVSVRGKQEESPNHQSLLLNSYDPRIVAEITGHLNTTVVQLSNSFRKLLDSQSIDIVEIESNLGNFLKQATKESSAILGILAGMQGYRSTEFLPVLAERSTRLSFLSTITALSMGLSEQKALRVGLIGMLADASLIYHPDWFGQNGRLSITPTNHIDYQIHSFESAQLLRKAVPLDDEFLKSIETVHEQLDGSGFPSRLKEESIDAESRIVNVSDAYLSMSAMGGSEKEYLESDILAYLVYQTGLGKFDKNVIRALVKSLSMYPIGTMVRLDDESVAIVVEANPRNPLQPIVRSIDEARRVKDLSLSPNYIISAAFDRMPGRHRIEKGNMDKVLWMPASIAEEGLAS